MSLIYSDVNDLSLMLHIHVRVPIRLYTNCNYNDTLYYMLLELQVQVEGLLNPTL